LTRLRFITLSVTLKRADSDGRFKATARQLACDLTLESGIFVSVFVGDQTFLDQHKGYSFIEKAQDEGVRV